MGLGLVIAFVLVFAQLNYVQFFSAARIASNRANPRALIREYSIKRGDILSLNGRKLATSVATKDRLKYRRTYPMSELFGHITGYYSINYGPSRIESSYNDHLLGDSGVVSIQDIEDRFTDSEEQGNRVRLTVHTAMQEAARTALGDERGAVVALDPTSGEVLAMWSNPSFDPEPLASHSSKQQKKAWDALDPASPTGPLVNIATNRGYPPGSTFKVVTTAAALEAGYPPDRKFEDPDELELPLTDDTLTNFTNRACTGTGTIQLFQALVISCDTTFGKIGLEIPNDVFDTAEGFGFNQEIPFDVRTEVSSYPEIPDDRAPERAKAAIGQQDVVATPLQMALVAAGVANDGEVLRPRLVREIIDPTGGIVENYEPEVISEAMSSETAGELTRMMVAAVATGTGTAARIPGVDVAGKTGTAQTVKGANPHTWFIAFAPADDPQIAIAVIVEHGGSFGSEATGGAVAAPIAQKVMLTHQQLSEEW